LPKLVRTKKRLCLFLKNILKKATDGQIALSYNTQIHLFMQSNDERIYISLDLQSPILNAKMPNNVSWHTLTKRTEDYLHRCLPLWNLLTVYNQQVPWNEYLDQSDIFKFINDGNDINILTENHDFIGWAWQNKKTAEALKLKKHQIYQSKWLVDKKYLFKKLNKGLSLAWIQELKKYYRSQGFTQGLAYIDDWNKGVLKSVLRAGYEIKNWNK